MANIQVFNTTDVQRSYTEKTNTAGVRLLTRAEYRKKYGITGRSEAGKRHDAYLMEEGIKANANVTARIAKGEVLIVGEKLCKNTGRGTLNYVEASSIGTVKAENDVKAANEKAALAEAKLAEVQEQLALVMAQVAALTAAKAA